MKKPKRTSQEKGITLVALIITIIVLLILAVVAIRAVQGDGIISHAKNAAKQTNIAQEKEELQMAVLEWQLANKNGEPTLLNFLGEKYSTDNVQLNTDKSITVTMSSGNRYKVTTSGEASLLDGTVEEPIPIAPEIILDKTSITKEIESGATETDTITATLNNARGDLTWTSSDTSVAEISGEGNTRTITLKKAGTATITVNYETVNATCTVTVTEPINISKGAFVEYNVAYTDVYHSSYQYSATNGWRLLDYTDNGDGTLSNVKLISTGVPAKLYYYYNDTTNNSWYVTNESKLTEFINVLTNNGTEDYTFYSGESTYYGLQASAGMYYNFGDIKFAYATLKRGNNLGYFTKITTNGTTYDSTNNTDKEPTGNNLFVPTGVNASVRLLTLPEMNKMLGRTDIDSTSTLTDPEGAEGLFVLSSVSELLGLESRSYGSIEVLLFASPYPGSSYGSSVTCCQSGGGVLERNGNGKGTLNLSMSDFGVRPVVTLSSNVQLVDENGDGVLEIK